MKYQIIEPKIIDNFLPEGLSERIENICNQDHFPWFYLDSISGIENKSSNEIQYGFGHILYDNEPVSPYYTDFYPIVCFIEDRYDIKIKELLRVRVGLTLRVDNEKSNNHLPHVDYQFPHKTFLYYVNDSDGDTIFYKKELNGFQEQDRISPIRNRAVLFDGKSFHGSSTPIKNYKRFVVNINFT